jgi:hypothetical protein
MSSRIVLLARLVYAPLLPALLFDQAMKLLEKFGVIETWPPVLPVGCWLAPPLAVAPVRTRTRRVAPAAPVGVAVTVIAIAAHPPRSGFRTAMVCVTDNLKAFLFYASASDGARRGREVLLGEDHVHEHRC